MRGFQADRELHTAEDGQPSAEGVEVVHGPPRGACRRQAGPIQWIPLSSTAEKVRLLPAHVSGHAHDDASARARPVVTREAVSLLLGYERPRSAMAASYAVVPPVLRWKFLTAGTAVAVAAPLSVRSFHLLLVTVDAVALRGATRSSAGGGRPVWFGRRAGQGRCPARLPGQECCCGLTR